MTDAALRHVAAEPFLYRRHPRQAACRSGWAEEGRPSGPSGGIDVDRLGSALMEAIDRLLQAEAIAQGRATVLGLH
jgi:hypothetical protein